MDYGELFCKQKEAIRRRTREVAGMVRTEDLVWRPEKDALSIGEMLRHLWVSEEGVRRVALDGNFAYYEKRIPQGLRAVLGTPGALADELARLESVHQETLRLVTAFPPERMEEERVHAELGFRRKTYIMLLGINEHEIHHRAQLMVYLRMLGRPVAESINRR
ncbi:MAG: DinB family protein [Acidobacteria bacterium]|nr:DinB family protein [Acidobacteriota bacterium]MCL5288810.1 DinB family protein [Acidobacteriota bacterium]